ncbi:MAG TPA: type II secretion system protein [Candidatus Woesebacteria bacterium]|nr:type II secretion system protein [Candidatus Woesebacteria bacterium]
MKNVTRFRKGFTMVEMMIIMALIGILSVSIGWQVTRQLSRARDSERKDDLAKIKLAFEDYYNDNESYPPDDTILTNCGGAQLMPYLPVIPCDPSTHDPYLYEPDLATGGYRVYAILENPAEKSVTDLNCGGSLGCNVPGFPAYNYGVAVGVPVRM